MAGGGSAPGPVNKQGVHSPSQSFNKYTNQPMTQLEHIYAQVNNITKTTIINKSNLKNKSPDYESQLGPRSFVSLTAQELQKGKNMQLEHPNLAKIN